jgi:hypothetical protein
MQKIYSTVKEYLPYVVVVLIVLFPLFTQQGYILLTDFVFGPHIDLDWKDGWFVMNIILKVLSFVLSAAFVQKMFLFLLLLGVLLGGRYLVRYFVSDKLLVFVISIFALFNPFIYDRLMFGQVGVVLAFGTLFFFLGALLRYVDERQDRQLIHSSVYAGIGLLFASQFIFFFGLVFLLFLILYFKKWGITHYKQFIKILLCSLLVCCVINANWLVANVIHQNQALDFTTSEISDYDFLAFRTVGDSDYDVIKNVTRMSGFWGSEQYRYADLASLERNWARSFAVLLPFIIFGFVVGLRDRKTRILTIGLGCALLIAIVLASGISLSFTRNITHWLFEHVPIYRGLRETQKWGAVIVVVYAVFISTGVSVLLRNIYVARYKKAVSLFLGIVIIMQAPLLLGGFFGQIQPVQYPADWYIAEDTIECSNNEQILLLPWHMYMSYSWTHSIIASPAPAFFSCPVLVSTATEFKGIYDNSNNAVSQSVVQWVQQKGESGLLHDEKMNIGYIVVAKDADWENYTWLEELAYIKQIQDTETLQVYKVY